MGGDRTRDGIPAVLPAYSALALLIRVSTSSALPTAIFSERTEMPPQRAALKEGPERHGPKGRRERTPQKRPHPTSR